MDAVIFGCGWQGLRYVKALDDLNINLDSIVDINPKAVSKSLPNFDKNLIYENADNCFNEHEPDVAIISTTSPSRLACIKKCVESGVKKIFCEKPMATNLHDALEIINITESNGCILSVNHIRRSSPNHLKLKTMIKEGVIGQIRHIYFQSGSVGLGNVGSHIIDNIRFYTDSEIDWVSGVLDNTGTASLRGPQFTDPGGWGMMMMKNGTRIFIDTCEDTGVPHVFEMVGTYGRVVIEELNNNWQILARAKSDWDIPLTKIPTPIYKVDFIKTIPFDVGLLTKNGLYDLIFNNKVNCTGYDGYKAIEGIIAMHLSHRNKSTNVNLPLSDENMNFNVSWA